MQFAKKTSTFKSPAFRVYTKSCLIHHSTLTYFAYETMKEKQKSLTNISIKLLRDRIGMPNLNLVNANATPDPYMENQYPAVSGTNKGVILEIRRERGIELIMEGFRWNDVMRWKAGALMTRTFKGIYFPGVGEYDMDKNGTIDLI